MSTLLDKGNLKDILVPYVRERGGLLPALHAIQKAVGFVPQDWIEEIADAFNLSRAEVHGTISFYHDFHDAPRGQKVVRICQAEACQAVGARELADHARKSLGIEFGETTPDGKVTLEKVYCLGNCACGPSVEVGNLPVAHVTHERFDQLIASAPQQSGALPQGGTFKVYVPFETTAVARGAEDVAALLAEEARSRNLDIHMIRTGSRGLHWLEPMIEVEVDGARVAYGPVSKEDVASLFESNFLSGGDHRLNLGDPEGFDWIKGQDRQVLKRCGIIDPTSAAAYQETGGFEGLKRALDVSPQQVVDALKTSGLRGRGGAGFPAGIKWQTVLDQQTDEKFVVCNADEGDSGTFSDRVLMEGDPFTLIEGMTIAAHATGARHGYIYLRSEYPLTEQVLGKALQGARDAGWLGANIAGKGLDFDITLRIGAGSYVCGEETALLESLEGKRGQVRAKPPLPAIEGLFGAPTLVNNVITLASVPQILVEGAESYAGKGVGRSKGTLPVQLAGNVKRGGVVEVPFGISLRTLVEGYGGGTRSGRPIRAIQVGGPLGAYLPASQLDLPLDYEALAEAGGLLGHGGIVVFDDTVDMLAQARFAMEFCAVESCGKCTPCRIGAVRGVEVINLIFHEGINESNQTLLEDLLETMEDGSLCAMGGLTPLPVKSALRHFPEDFQKSSAAAE